MTSNDPNLPERLCIKCLKKNPPVDTILIPGENILESQYRVGNFVCNECRKEYQMQRKKQLNSADYSKYIQELEDQTKEELAQQWADPVYAKLRTPDRVYKIWDKYKRRVPEQGVRKAWILPIVFEDLWNMQPEAMVEDFFKEMNWPKSKQNTARPYLLQFIIQKYDFLLTQYRKLAEARWDSTVGQINKSKEGKDKLVAKPYHTDPYTKEEIANWFLLSRRQEQKWREAEREAGKVRADVISEYEQDLTNRRERIEKRQEQEQEKRRDNSDGDSVQGEDRGEQ